MQEQDPFGPVVEMADHLPRDSMVLSAIHILANSTNFPLNCNL